VVSPANAGSTTGYFAGIPPGCPLARRFDSGSLLRRAVTLRPKESAVRSTSASLSNCVSNYFLGRGVREAFKEGIEVDQELAHDGGEGDFAGFAR